MPATVTPEPSPGAGNPPKHGSHLWLAVVIALLCVGGLVWLVKVRQKQAEGPGGFMANEQAAPVIVGTVAKKTIPVYLDGLGNVQAFNTVTVKSQVDGQLVKVAFTEGQDVHVGDLLAQIDPAPFQAALEQAQAKKAQDQATLTNAQVDLQRDEQLIKDKIVTEQALATQQAVVASLLASVKADQAGIDSAAVQLKYSTITSPIDGRCGIRLVDQGNIVHPTDTNGLVIITQLRPISVVFTLPEQYTGQLAAKFANGSLKVEAFDRDNQTVLGEGKLAVIDNQIDTSTGTIKLKATFPNDDLRLWPGQFVNARAIVDSFNGLIVPASVIQHGPEGEYAYVIKDKVAKVQALTVARTQDGQAFIADSAANGLRDGDIVVVDGQYRLQDGTKVIYNEPSAQAKPSGLAAHSRTNGAAASIQVTE